MAKLLFELGTFDNRFDTPEEVADKFMMDTGLTDYGGKISEITFEVSLWLF